jgi:hypothetical protein
MGGYIFGNFYANTSGVNVMITIFCAFRQFSSNQSYGRNLSKTDSNFNKKKTHFHGEI